MGKHSGYLKSVLQDQGRKQTWLCEQTDIHVSWMTKLVNGHALPRVDDAIKIARALNKTVEELWGDDVK